MTENNYLIDAFQYDGKGYFDGQTMWQVLNGEEMPAPNSTKVCPWKGEADPSVFYQFADGKWTTEKKPTCAADLIGVVVSHSSMTQHDIEMRDLIQRFSEEDGYRQVRGADLSWALEKIPEKTAEEKRKEAEEQARSERDRKIEETDYLMMADYPITDKCRAEVKQYRQELRDVPMQSGFPFEVEWPVMPKIEHL